jgi:hypothetical protein
MSLPIPERPMIPETYGFTASTPHKPPSWQSIAERIRISRNYWICSVSPDGSPHALPVWGIWLDNELYFVTKRASKKGQNLLANPKVAIHLESGDDVIAFQGKVMEVIETLHFARVAAAHCQKYNGDQIYPAIEVVFQLMPRFSFTWSESSYHETATRWQF